MLHFILSKNNIKTRVTFVFEYMLYYKCVLNNHLESIMLKAKLILLKPNKEQEKLFWQFSNTARFIYNECLAHKIKMYQTEGISLNTTDLIKYIQHA